MTKNTRNLILFLSAAWCCLLLTGCSLSPIKTPRVSTYTISNWEIRHTNQQTNQSKNTILVSTPSAAPGYRSSDMVYVTIPFKLKSFATNRWVAPPAKLLLPLIANQLQKTNKSYVVVTSPFSGASTFQLNTQLLMLQQEFFKPISQIHLMVQATLINSKTSQVVATKVFNIFTPAPENNPYSGVLAANKAAKQLALGIARFVKHATN